MKNHWETDNEQWMEGVKKKLENYSEPLPPSAWERLEKDLAKRRLAPPTGYSRMFHLRRWGVAAAAVLLAAISGVSLWFLQSPLRDEVGNTEVPRLALQPSVEDSQPLPPSAEVKVESPHRPRPERWMARAEQTSELVMKAEEEIPSVTTDGREKINSVESKDEAEGEQASVASQKVEKERSLKPSRPSSRDKLHLPADEGRRKADSRWSIGFSVGNAGGSGNSLYDGHVSMSDYAYMAENSLDLASTANGILAIPTNQEVVFKEGLPYLLNRSRQIASADHKLPVSAGLSVRKHLWGPFSVETGLTYTYLASDIKYEGSVEKVEQKLHYIGIPLRFNWSFINRKPFIMYLSAGGTMEKCVYGKLGDEDQTVKPLQFSLAGVVGAQVNAGRHVGIYVEPGVSYFFDDGSSVETIRKETPFNFTLQAGIRLTY